MNAWRIAIYIFAVHMLFLVAVNANIPISCNSDNTACTYFTDTTIATTTLPDIISGQVDESQYQSAKIESNIFGYDVVQNVVTAINKLISTLLFMITGAFNLVRFFFGASPLTFYMGILLQGIVEIFYLAAILDKIRSGSGSLR